MIDSKIADDGRRAIDSFIPDWRSLRAGAAQDGVVVPALVNQLRRQVSAPEDLHRGATSQDVLDTSLALTLAELSRVLDLRLAALTKSLGQLNTRFGTRLMMGKTRMQSALDIPVGHRIEAWRAPLLRAHSQLAPATEQVALLSLGGPVGTGQSFGSNYDAVAASMARNLGLVAPGRARHAERDGLVAYGDLLSRISGTLGKMGQDLVLMAQQGVEQVQFIGGGSSSAMPHKQNPVLAELLVTLARFNAAQVGALHSALIHEQERSGAAWALEWMVLPQMAATTGRGLSAAIELIDTIKEIAP